MTSSTRPVALVTGGTTGIGLATARLLHAEGYAVVVTGKNPETLAAARSALPEDVVVVRADSRSLADAAALAAEIRERFGKLDLVFLNAGGGRFSPFDALDESTFDELFDVNVKGQVFTLQKVLPLLERGGSVVFNCSLSARRGTPRFGLYAASKGALLSLSRTLAVELAPRGIRVNALVVGPIDTPALAKVGLPDAALSEFKDHLEKVAPLGRLGTDDEVAHAVAFLASRGAGFITGAEIAVDGGLGATLP